MSQSDHMTLVFQPNNPANTTIIDQDTQKVVYTVTTEFSFKSQPMTEFLDRDGSLIASCQWQVSRSDLLTFRDQKPIRSSAFMKKSILPFSDSLKITDHKGRQFKWKTIGACLQYNLYHLAPGASKAGKLIAVWKKEYDGTATLDLDETAQEIQDIIVISFCLLEKDRRAAAANANFAVGPVYAPVAPLVIR